MLKRDVPQKQIRALAVFVGDWNREAAMHVLTLAEVTQHRGTQRSYTAIEWGILAKWCKPRTDTDALVVWPFRG